MPSLPIMDKNVCHSPHVVLLGAGASRAAFLNGDANGKQLPLMNDFIEIVGLSEILDKEGIPYGSLWGSLWGQISTLNILISPYQVVCS